MKKVAWITYGSLIILFALINLWVAISTGNGLIVTVISSAFMVIYMAGLYGYVFHKAIWNPAAWRFLFWYNVTIICLRFLLSFLYPTAFAHIDVVFNALFTLPMLYALYQYSSSTCSVWGETHYAKQSQILSDLLKTTNNLTASVTTTTPAGNETTTVLIDAEEIDYIVRIKKKVNDEVKSFSDSFSDLESVARFLENNTSIRAGDFA